MVDVPPVETLDHELAWEAKVLTHLYRFLIDRLRREVLCDATVVNVAELAPIVFLVEQIVNVDVIDIALDVTSIHTVFLITISTLLTTLLLFFLLDGRGLLFVRF